MPETSAARPAEPADEPIVLDEAMERFVETWGAMGASWGIPRTMAQVHALLFAVGRPVTADEVVEALGISRGNASMTLRRLEEWHLVARRHRRGDRRDFFEAEQDPWKVLRIVVEERRKREVDPLIAALEECRRDGDDDDGGFNDRVGRMIELVTFIQRLGRHVSRPDSGPLLELVAAFLEQEDPRP